MALTCHDVIIDNFKTNETVPYSFIIIKGHIITQLGNIQQHDESNDILLICNETTERFPLNTDGNFKILTNLQSGENNLKIQFNCKTIEITINYQSNINHQIYTIIPLYIICDGHNGRFQAPFDENNDIQSACNRIDTCCKLLQTIFGEKLYENNFGRKSFTLGSDCQVFYSKLNYLKAWQLEQHELWEVLAKELLNSDVINEENQKILAFLSCTNYRGGGSGGDGGDYNQQYDYKDLLKLTDGYVALGGGGFALFGTPCLFTWPENLQQVLQRFQDKTVIDRRRFLDDSCYRGTYGACFSTTLGSVLHELCHTFDLGHTDNGIMGRGFDNIHTIFLSDETRLQKTNLLETYRNKIEFQENLEFEKQQQPKQSIVIHKTHLDENFWSKSCLMILAYHKWFNDFPPIGDNYTLKYDQFTKIVTSTKGLRVIELRRDSDGYVTNFWTFEGRIFKYTFQLPEIAGDSGEHIIIIVDNFDRLYIGGAV